MRESRRFLAAIAALALIAAACNSEETAPPTTAPATTTTTTQPPTTTTTTTTEPPTTTTSTIPYAALDAEVAGDDGASAAVDALYSWFGDRTLPAPDIPESLAEHLAHAFAIENGSFEGEFFSEQIGEMGAAGVAVLDEDVILLVDDGGGWRVVGAWLERFGVDPWFGNPIRHVFVIGTDARPGQDQRNFRADSLHILASNIIERSGGILGIPRDTYVQASYGSDKFTNVNAMVFTLSNGTTVGQDEMVDLAAGLSGLPLEGYIVTGFLNFHRLVDAFGGVEVDVPFSMAEPKSEAYLSAGLQVLFGRDALAFSRNRTIPGGDFTRSFHHGLVILAALDGVLQRNLAALPGLLSMLDEFTWTNLSLEDLLTVAAGGFLLDPSKVGNAVLPGLVVNRGGASVVDLTEEAEDMFRDLDDGSLAPGISPAEEG